MTGVLTPTGRDRLRQALEDLESATAAGLVAPYGVWRVVEAISPGKVPFPFPYAVMYAEMARITGRPEGLVASWSWQMTGLVLAEAARKLLDEGAPAPEPERPTYPRAEFFERGAKPGLVRKLDLICGAADLASGLVHLEPDLERFWVVTRKENEFVVVTPGYRLPPENEAKLRGMAISIVTVEFEATMKAVDAVPESRRS